MLHADCQSLIRKYWEESANPYRWNARSQAIRSLSTLHHYDGGNEKGMCFGASVPSWHMFQIVVAKQQLVGHGMSSQKKSWWSGFFLRSSAKAWCHCKIALLYLLSPYCIPKLQRTTIMSHDPLILSTMTLIFYVPGCGPSEFLSKIDNDHQTRKAQVLGADQTRDPTLGQCSNG